jgi:hypothetical protein
MQVMAFAGKAPDASQDKVTESPSYPSSHEAVHVSAYIKLEQLAVSMPSANGKVLASHGSAVHVNVSKKSPGEWSAFPPHVNVTLLPV